MNIEDYDLVDIIGMARSQADSQFYDLTVEDDHSFFIDLNGNKILSHNCDGTHIKGLLILLFKKFWPELLTKDRIVFFETPSRIVTYKNKEYNFFDDDEYYKFIDGKNGYRTKYCKGLGSHNSAKFKELINDPKSYVKVDYDSIRDDDLLGMAFDPKRSDDRKEWVAIL